MYKFKISFILLFQRIYYYIMSFYEKRKKLPTFYKKKLLFQLLYGQIKK